MTSQRSRALPLSLRLRSVAVAAAGLVAIGSASACSAENIAGDIIEAGSDGQVDVDIDDGEVTVETEDGSATLSSSGDLPEGFPSDVPVLEGAITFSQSIDTGESGTSYTVLVDVSDTVADAFSQVKSEMTAAGFETTGETTVNTDDGAWSTATFTSADHQVIVSVTDAGDSTTVSYGVTPPAGA